MKPIEQQFFNDLKKKLWTAAYKLREYFTTPDHDYCMDPDECGGVGANHRHRGVDHG